MLEHAALTVLFLTLAGLASWRAWFILNRYKTREASDIKADKKAESGERVWRTVAHFFWLVSLCPIPIYFSSEVDRLALWLQQLLGPAVAAGIILAVIKFAREIKLRSLLIRDLSWATEAALTALGGFGSFLLATIWAVMRHPELRAELLKALTK